MKIAIIGNITIDENDNEGNIYIGPGGSAYFIGKTLSLLNIPNIIISPLGFDFPQKYLSGLNIFSQKLKSKNLKFHNTTKNSIRTQKVEYRRSGILIDPNLIPKKFILETQTLLFCPVIDNLTLDYLKKFKKIAKPQKIVLLPQGIFRQIENDQSITKNGCHFIDELLPHIDFMIYSEEDCRDALINAQKWSRGETNVIVTLDKKGCDLFIKAKRTHFDTFSNDFIVDLNGAGDVFAGLLISSLTKGFNLTKAIKFANAGAALSKSFHSENLNFTWKILQSIVEKGRVGRG
ncbi:hypothetical protein HYW54_04160 [Candidatus Gottesmanbacteria bacterium]|nr:hypothetical protein [Candidatus Gottesmanbacteria bacterium]